jgi:magnesium transporter
MLTAHIKYGDGSTSTGSTPEELTRALKDPKAIFWLDMLQPTDEELGLLDDVFGFHPLAIEDSIKRAQRPKIEGYRHIGETCSQPYWYMVIHGPDIETFKEHLRLKELDLFFSQRYLVTIHDEKMLSVEGAYERVHADLAEVLEEGIDVLLHRILDKLVDLYEPIFDYLTDSIDNLEDDAINCPTPELLQNISERKRELLTLRRIIGPQREVIAQLTRGDVPIIRESTRVYFRDVLDHLNRAVETIELYRDLVVGARDIYMSSVSNNMNRVMKTLTIITVLALPINLVTGFFGMNFEHLPGIGSTQAFYTAVATMLLSVIGILLLFRKLKWL